MSTKEPFEVRFFADGSIRLLFSGAVLFGPEFSLPFCAVRGVEVLVRAGEVAGLHFSNVAALRTCEELIGFPFTDRILMMGRERRGSLSTLMRTLDRSKNSPWTFFNECVRLKTGAIYPQRALYEKYLEYCKRYKLEPKARRTFNRFISSDLGISSRRERVEGRIIQVWVGIELLEEEGER